MMDNYTRDSYTVVQATQLIHEAVEHLLSLEGSDVTGELKRDLLRWQEEEDTSGRGSEIPFELVQRIHKQLQQNPIDGGCVRYLHELLEGSELVLPTLKPPDRSPELVARLEKIKMRVEQQEYDRMVKNVNPNKMKSEMYKLGLEVQATSRQLWAVVNFLLTVIGAFVFGYFAAYYADFDVPVCVFMGLIFATAAFLADLYFLVRTTSLPKTKKSL